MRHVIILLFSVLSLGAAAQQGTIRGRVVDARNGENIEYANIALLKAKDSTLVNGTVSEANGTFRLTAPHGSYLLRVTFIGYDTYFHTKPVALSAGQKELNVGKLQLKMSGTMMEAVEISAERSMVEYQLDKRVVNVDKNIVAGGGTATDVLEQVPSVAIDNDGNVTLRGSTNVKVLVNGRPSELLASDLNTLLEQIPASTVENVEVITNPSAKYDPEGMSGIINIKLKDRTAGALGLNGVASLNMGAPVYVPSDMRDHFGFKDYATLMGNISLNYTTEKYNLFLTADGGQRARGNYGTSDIEYLNPDGTARSHYLIDQYSAGPAAWAASRWAASTTSTRRTASSSPTSCVAATAAAWARYSPRTPSTTTRCATTSRPPPPAPTSTTRSICSTPRSSTARTRNSPPTSPSARATWRAKACRSSATSATLCGTTTTAATARPRTATRP